MVPRGYRAVPDGTRRGPGTDAMQIREFRILACGRDSAWFKRIRDTGPAVPGRYPLVLASTRQLPGTTVQTRSESAFGRIRFRSSIPTLHECEPEDDSADDGTRQSKPTGPLARICDRPPRLTDGKDENRKAKPDTRINLHQNSREGWSLSIM